MPQDTSELAWSCPNITLVLCLSSEATTSLHRVDITIFFCTWHIPVQIGGRPSLLSFLFTPARPFSPSHLIDILPCSAFSTAQHSAREWQQETGHRPHVNNYQYSLHDNISSRPELFGGFHTINALSTTRYSNSIPIPS